MFVGNPEAIDDMLMNAKGICPNCHTELQFKESALLAKNNGVTEDAVMCKKCHKVFTVNLTLNNMTITNELTKYNFTNFNTSKNTTGTLGTESKINQIKDTNSLNKEDNNNISSYSNQNPSDNESIIESLFYKKDKNTDELRIAKTKTISLIFFMLMFISLNYTCYINYGFIEITDIITSLILSIITTSVIYALGWIIGVVLENKYQQTIFNNNNSENIDNSNDYMSNISENNQHNQIKEYLYNENIPSEDISGINIQQQETFTNHNEETHEKSREYYHNQASKYLESKSWKEGNDLCKQWTEDYPDDDFAWYTNSLFTLQLGLFDESKESIINAQTLKPNQDAYDKQYARIINTEKN